MSSLLKWFSYLLIILVLFSCSKKPTNSQGGPEPIPLPRFFDHPAWHPQGQWIAAEHSDSVDIDGDGKPDRGFAGIWLVNSSNGEKQPLISGFGLPAWSPDGKKLALMRTAQIFTVEVTSLEPAQVDTNTLKQLTFQGNNFYPSWSPDGEWIAFDSNLDDPVGMYVIWLIKSDGSSRKDISIHGTGEWRMPSWTPDQKVVHIRFIGVTYPEIFVMDSTGNNARRVTVRSDDSELNPKVSSKHQMVFSSVPRKGYPTICTIHLDGTGFRQLTNGPDYRPAWSPDGERIVFLHWNFLEEVPGNGQLWIMDANGSNKRQLTFDGW
jgi:TolB protein